MALERLPDPNVIIPTEAETLLLMLKDQRLEWLGSLASQGKGSYDGHRKDRQARANLDYLLDHYPNGTPRDYIVQYTGKPAIPAGEMPDIPANVVLGD